MKVQNVFTNASAMPLEYHATKQNTNAQCQAHMADHGIHFGDMNKNRMKVMAQFLPTYTYDKDTSAISKHKACTLPMGVMNTYDINGQDNNFNCYLQNPSNIKLRLSDGKNVTDVTNGCIAPFGYDETVNYKGDMFNSPEQVNNMLDNAYEILDYEMLLKIRTLEDNVKKLRKERDRLENEDLPRSNSQLTEAKSRYILSYNECDRISSQYNRMYAGVAEALEQKKKDIEYYELEANKLKATLKDDYQTKVTDKIMRNIKELSFVTLFKNVMNVKNESNASTDEVLSGGEKITFVHNISNLTRENINDLNLWRYDKGTDYNIDIEMNDNVSSIYIPRGMEVALFEHWDKNGREANYGQGGETRASNTVVKDLGIQMNDRVTSLTVKGGFITNVMNNKEFAWMVDNPPNAFDRDESKVSGGSGGVNFDFQCPNGHFINEFRTSYDSYLNSLEAICSDGSRSSHGEKTGNDNDLKSTNGFVRANIWAGAYIDSIQMVDANGNTTDKVGGKGGDYYQHKCGTGRKIKGIRGTAGKLIDSLGFICD